jgi:hypothetical protein
MGKAIKDKEDLIYYRMHETRLSCVDEKINAAI